MMDFVNTGLEGMQISFLTKPAISFTLDSLMLIWLYVSLFASGAGVAQLVEHKLPKLGVAGSNLVARSI